MTKTQHLLEQISEQIASLNIAGYLKEEAIASLKYLHRYKLKNIEKNLTCFCEYLLFLNQQNTDKILNLSPSTSKNTCTRDLKYFFCPHKKMPAAASKKSKEMIQQGGYELLTLMQGIKGILVLSIDEFCNASPTRMSIHQMLMENEDSVCCSKKAKKK